MEEPPAKRSAEEQYRSYCEYLDRVETRNAANEICASLNHETAGCQCFEKIESMVEFEGLDTKGRTVSFHGEKPDLLRPALTIKSLSKSTPLTSVRKDNDEAKRRREIKTKLFMDLGIIRTNDGIDDKENKREETIKRKVKETIVTTYCELCAQNFSSAKMLLLHNSKVHGTSSLECHMCLKKFNTTSAFNKHMKTHYGPTALYHVQCEMCDRKFKDKESLTTHMKVTHFPHET
ncbi:unnamed protein product [Caenorhabditis bovis]|uniref:C2H2-type domain-containing protein n=1 Tax=Caenorhabditis bovis TaxID=2654633 RepID=A0A8S1EK81_9PELO|nr:unnamed protein product [Caenorhabditis bovis]